MCQGSNSREREILWSIEETMLLPEETLWSPEDEFVPGFGYQQQLVPGMRPGGAPMPNFVVPMVQQEQPGQRPGGRRAGAVAGQQAQQPVPLVEQQMLPRGLAYLYPPGHGMPYVSMAGRMLSAPHDMGGMQLHDQANDPLFSVGVLTSLFVFASPREQTMMLGESLFPLVEQLKRRSAAKITGMLLELEQTEVLHLIESPEALSAKVAEAMEVLRVAQEQQTSTQS